MSLLLFIGLYLAARKVTDDLDAFQPGPPRLSDLLVFLVVLELMVLLAMGLAIVPARNLPLMPAPIWWL